MSNSSLLDLTNNKPIDPIDEQNLANLRPSQEKALQMQETSKAKAEALAQSSKNKIDKYATPEQIVTMMDEQRKAALSKISIKDYRKMADSLDTDYTSDTLKAWLQEGHGLTSQEANIVGDEMLLSNIRKKQANIDPNRVTDRTSTSMTGDLALSFLQGVQDNAIKPAIEGMRRSLTIPEAPQKGKFPDLTLSVMDSAKGFTAAIFGKEAEEGNAKVNKFFNDALIGQQENAQILESAKSIPTKVSTAAKEQMIAEFEATAKDKYPNGFVRAAAGILKGMESLAANPRLLATETAKQAPNLITGGLFGSLSKKILTRGKTQEEAQKWLQNEGKEQAEALSKRIGVSTVALQEGMSNGVDAKLDVLNTSIADLESNSPEYKKLIDKNYSPEQARNMLSDTAFDWAFGISATVGAVTSLGLGTGKLNANSFRGTNPVTATGKEMTEELIQSGSGAFAGNVAASKTTDPNRELDKGVGVAAGQGAILGGTTAGGMSTVGAILDGTVADVAGTVANTVGTKLDVVFNGSGNKFTKENIKHVSSGDYSKLTGDTIDEKIESVLSTAAMKPFKNDHVKIGNHINKLLEVMDAEFTAKEKALPVDATDKDRLDLINKYTPVQDKLLKMIDSINAQVVLQRTPLPEDATDEQKAARILTFGSMRPQEDSEFDELNNLANSPNITSDQKDALTSLAEVRQTLSELRSSGGVKGMTTVAKDVLEGTTLENGSKKDNWRGIQTYVNNILGAIQANVPKAAEFELKQMTRFRNQRSLKYQLAKAYMEANTVEGRRAAGEAYINAFGKSSPELMARAERGEALVVPKLFKQLEFEYNAMESALSGMANVYKATSKMRATEAVESAFAANTPATVAPAVTTPTATAEAVPTANPIPTLKDGSPVDVQVEESPKSFSSLVRMEFGEPKTIKALSSTGEVMGTLTYMPNGGPIDVMVEEPHRRKGVATILYDKLEQLGGKVPAMSEGIAVSKDAEAFRNARDGKKATVQDPVQEAVSPEFKADSFEYTPPPVVPEVEAIQATDKVAGNTIAPEIVDEVEIDDSAAPDNINSSIKDGSVFSEGIFKMPVEKGSEFSNLDYCKTCANKTVKALKSKGYPAIVAWFSQKDFSGYTELLGDHSSALTEIEGVRYLVDHPQRDLFNPLNPPVGNTGIVAYENFTPTFIKVTAENLTKHYGLSHEDAVTFYFSMMNRSIEDITENQIGNKANIDKSIALRVRVKLIKEAEKDDVEFYKAIPNDAKGVVALQPTIDKEQVKDEQPKTEASDKTATDTAEKTSETTTETSTKRARIDATEKAQRVEALRNEATTPKGIKDAIDEAKTKGKTISDDTLIRGEKAVARAKEKAETKAKEKAAREEAAAKVTEFKDKAYPRIMEAFMFLKDMTREDAKTMTKNLVAKWKLKLADNSVAAVLSGVDAYVTGLKESATLSEPREGSGKIYMLGYNTGKSINASVARGKIFIQGNLKSKKREELSKLLVAVKGLEPLEFMKAADPLQYVLDYLDKGKPAATNEILSQKELEDHQIKENAAESAKKFFIEFFNTFEATYESNTSKGSRYKDPSWAAFDKELVQLFRKEEDGKYPVVFKVAMAVQALQMLNNLPSYDHASRKEVASRLGMGGEFLITDEGFKEGLKLGNTLNNEIEALGSSILNFIGIKPNTSFDNNTVQTLVGSTGQLAFVVLENMGVVQVNYATVEQLDSWKKKHKGEKSKIEEREKVFTTTGLEITTGKVPFVTIKKVPRQYASEDYVTSGDDNITVMATSDKAAEYSTFSQATNVSKALEEMFELNPAARIPTTTEPTMDDVPKYFSGTKQLVPEEQREAYLSQMKRQWQSKRATSFLFEEYLTDAQAAQVAGAAIDFTAFPKYLRAKMEAKTRALIQEIKQTRAAVRTLGDQPFYMHLDAWRIGRTGYLNTLLNPQASKFARHIMSMKDWVRPVDMNNEKQAELFKVALAFNFGITIDKRNNVSEVIQKLEELTSKAEFEELLWAYNEMKDASDNQNNPDYEPTGNDALVVKTFMELMTSEALWGKGATSSWSKVEALAEYAAMVKADGKPFTTSLMVEIDGITNGVLIANILFGINDPQVLAKSGVFIKNSGITDVNGNPIEDYVEWTKDKGNTDPYQTLAKYTYEQSRSIFADIADKGRRLNTASLQEGEMPLTDDEKKSLQERLGLPKKYALTQKGVKLRLQQFNAAMAIVGTPLTMEGLISKAWRDLMKPSLMVTNYGAGINSVIENMLETIIETMHVEIGNANKGDKEYNRALDIIAALNVMMPKTPVTLPANPLDFEMSLEQIVALERFLKMAVGTPLDVALKTNYTAYNNRRDYINAVVNTHEQLGFNKIEARIKEWKDANGSNNWPSVEWLQQQMEELKEDLSVIPTALSSDVDSGLMINKLEKFIAERLLPEDRVVVESELNSLPDGGYRNIASQLGRKVISGAGVGTLAYVVQGLDGAVAIRLLAEFAVMNAHDGFGFAYDQVVEGANAANEILIKAIQEHTFWADIRAKHQKILDHVAAVNNEEDTITMMAEEGFLLGRDLEASVNRSKSWEASRDTIISNMTVVQQYYYPGTDYRPNGKEEAVVVSEDSIDTVADLLVDEFTKELEAEDKVSMGTFGTSNTQFNPDVNTTINSTTVLPLFETVVRMDSTEETPEHLDHLRNVLNAIVVGVVGPVEFALASKDAVTAGEYFPETNKIEMRIARDSSRVNPQQSAGAVFTHEILHPVLEAALEVDSKERTLIDKVFQAVKGAFKDATEMYPENATDEEKELMNGIFDYVFNNTEKVRRGRGTNAAGFTVDNTGNNYLSEFVNYALTDRLFMKMIDNPKVLKILNRPQFTPYESEGRSFLPKAMNSAVEWFINKFKQLTWVLTQKLFNVDGKLPSQMVFALAGRLAGANVNAISRMERTLKAVDKGNSKVRQAIINWVRDPILKAGRDARIKGNKGNLLFRAVVTPVRLGNAMATGVFHKAVDAAASRIDLAHDSLIASLWRDMKGATKENNLVLRIHAMSNKFVDQLRLVVRNDVVQHLRSEFKRKLTRNEKIAMNTIIVRGDLSVLVENQQSRANIIEVVGNQAKRDTLKLTLRSQLRKEYGANAGYYINMSRSLARKMAGLASNQYDTPDNANMIARIAGNSFYKASGDLLKAERIIDVLTTLEYLDLQNQTDLDAFVALAKEDERAVFNTIEYHSVTKVESFKSLFKNNKSLMRKGYLKEQFDPNVDLKYAATAEQEEELVRQGYELVGEVSQDAYDANAPVKMYRNGSAPMARNNAGAVSLQGTNAKGADIRQVNSQRGLDGELRLRNLRREIAGNHHELAGIEGHTDEVKLEPIFNEEGNVVSYRYMMSHRDKVKLLKLNENYDENLAGTAASQATKKTTEEVNTKVVEIMWDDFRDNYANEPNKFIEVSATTGDAKQREMYALLPKQMKQEAKGYFKDGRIFVRKDHYDYFFGFRKWSVTELGKKQFRNAQKSVMLDVVNTLLRQLNTPAVRNLEMGLQELAKMFKDVLVVKTGATLLANVASNLVTLALNGVNPITMVGAHFKGWMEVTKYQKQREEVAALQLKLKTDRLLTASERRAITAEILRGKQRMSINPVRFLVEEGVYQTITEDIADADGDYSLQSRVEEWAAPVTNKIPNLVKDVGDILFMTHNTRMYKFLRNATQISDFAARYVMHEHNMKNGMKEMDSVTKVVETFVNYDLPTHKGLQYLNDMGFILFTKYLLRTQKVILQTLQERPASVLSLMTFQYMTGLDIPDITDVSLITNPDALLFRVNDPVDSLFGVAQPHLVTGGM